MWEVSKGLIRLKSRQFRKGRHQPDFPSDHVACAYCDVCIHNIVYFPDCYTPVTNVGFAKKAQVALSVRLHRDEWQVQGNS